MFWRGRDRWSPWVLNSRLCVRPYLKNEGGSNWRTNKTLTPDLLTCTRTHAHLHTQTWSHIWTHIHTHKHKEYMEETIQFKIKITHTTCESIMPTLSFFSKRQALGISSVWVLRFPGIWILFIKQRCFLTFCPSLASSSLFSGLSSS